MNTCFVCEILKIFIGNMLNSMKESPTFYPFSSCITSWVKQSSELLVRLLLAWIVQKCNISCIGILKRGLFLSSNKSELTWKMKRIWWNDWTKLGSTRCVQIGHDYLIPFSAFETLFIQHLRPYCFFQTLFGIWDPFGGHLRPYSLFDTLFTISDPFHSTFETLFVIWGLF